MARRFMLAIDELRRLEPSACGDDMRLVWRAADATNLSVRVRVHGDALRPSGFDLVNLTVCGPRELRLLARQLEWYADRIERTDTALEEYDP